MKNTLFSPVFHSWCVHFYTSLGLIFSLLAVNAVVDKSAMNVAVFMAFAMFIDGTDGVLARKFNVSKWTPNFNGRKLDDIIDYLNYTFIPVFFIYQFDLLSASWKLVLFFVLLASAYGFCNEEAKTEDGFFTGFPSYWNVVALYLFWLDWPDWFAGALILFLAMLTFVPSKYISLNQTLQLKKLNKIFFIAWAIYLAVLLLQFETVDKRLAWLSLTYPLFYLSASVYLNFKSS